MKKIVGYLFLGILYIVILIVIVYKTYSYVSSPISGPKYDDRFVKTYNAIDKQDKKIDKKQDIDYFGDNLTRDRYNLDITFENNAISVNQTLIYTNPSHKPISHIKLYVYGHTNFEGFSLTKIESPFLKSQSYQGGFLDIYLDTPLPKEKSISINLEFKTNLKNTGRTALVGSELHMANFYFQPCLYTNDYILPIQKDFGEGYASNISDFYVSIHLPINYKVSSAGKMINEKKDDTKIHYDYIATQIRDYAFFASPNYIEKYKLIDGILIKAYFLTSDPKLHKVTFDTIEKVFSLYNESFGLYPYETFNIVFCNYSGAMEYSSLIMLDANILNNSNLSRFERVIAHESAHQWWYGVVGNDQGRNPWIDESLASYSEYYFWYHTYGEASATNYAQTIFNAYAARYEGTAPNCSVRSSLDCFNTEESYRSVVYRRGAMAWNSLEKDTSMESITTFLKALYSENRFKLLDETSFLNFTSHYFDETSFLNFIDYISKPL
jgi:hypothetical protein